VLTVSQQYQQTLDITIRDDEAVIFIVKGNYDVTLSGNYVVPILVGENEDSDDDDEEVSDYAQSANEDALMDFIIGGDDDELDVSRHLRTSAVKPNSKEENRGELKKQIKEVKAERKSLKRAAEEEGKAPSAFAG
jgi:hypothetical protein